MYLSRKTFRVTRVKHHTEDGLYAGEPLREKNARVVLEEVGKDGGDSITIISKDGSIDGYEFKLGDTYEIALTHRRDTEAGTERLIPRRFTGEDRPVVHDPAFMDS